MISVEFVNDKNSKELGAEIRGWIVASSFERGLITLGCDKNTIRIAPPLNIMRELIEEGLQIFETAVTKVEG